ncbi:tRNA pseudouridine(38-40) synthase TruA [Chryseosolibacter indicus]|uniref:tRNA pseudouridine synthase A n=1 Tax=Chryseosolibacter indicus TaxID=2782351 RepID=A0ABS5VQ94_9BACT|nr:tRNA pseudouridine(38-40) synthase TruA [Chryseosolibacter indicus]MBT1703607.1 tRNA pseudouridine(38-40) synthase TruA [Chryseosolibacter indicus]
MRYFFEIAYNGKNYSGWQSQQNSTGIQTVVEEAMSLLLQEKIKITGSGRTDAGVHCEQQFFHVDITSSFDTKLLSQKLNSFLPQAISIQSIQPVREEAHARYDAFERAYRYQITRKKNPFLEGYALYFFRPLDIRTMNEAAALLVGEHDFECFSKVKTDVNNFICTIKEAFWEEKGDLFVFNISANRFLRGMVRAIVGTLLDVGTGKITVADFKAIISSRDRRKAGANVPPYGLFLVRVQYPSTVFVK